MILIYSEQPGSSVGLPGGIVAGYVVGQRVYQAVGNFLSVDGDNDGVISEDAAIILSFPGFSLASAEQQNSYAASQSGKSGKLVESKASKSKSSDDAPINGG